MTVELQNNLINVSKVFNATSTKNIIEEDIIVPDSKPDVVTVLQSDARIKIKSKEVYKDMMVVRGTADFKILYMSDDPVKLICSIDYETKFDYTVDVQDIEQNMKISADCALEHLDCSILNGRKLNIKAILNLDVKVLEENQIQALYDLSAYNNIQTLTKTLDTYKSVDYEEIEAEIQYDTEIPVGKAAIKEILKTDAIIKEKDVKIAGNKAIVKGNIELSTLYVPDLSEEKLEFVVNEVPFSEMLDIEDVDFADNYNLSIELSEIKTEVKEDDDGDARVISQNITLGFKPYTLKKQTFEVICDAYGLSSKIEPEKKQIKINELIEDTKTQLNIKESAVLSNMPVPKQIYNITYKPIIDQVKAEDEKVTFGGTIETSILYLSDDENNPFASYLYYIPFKQTINITGINENMHPEVRAEVDNFTYNLKEEEVELKFNITAYIRVMNEVTCDIITKVEEMPLDSNIKRVQPSMIVYYVQNGDTLWNISKKYLTTVREIIRINSIEDSDTIAIGQQLLIPKIE